MSTSAASSLSPAFPARAPWGTAGKLRAWQQAALAHYLERDPRDFLAVATPGAGKTTFALRVATELLERRRIASITVVAPTEHLKRQWAEAAHRVGISLDPDFRGSSGGASADYDGVAVTYAGVAVKPMLHRNRVENRKTLVIFDEVHHAGDALSWGESLREAFEPATRRLALTGTPFRSDVNPIPFVTYAPDAAGVRRSVPDSSYGYADALRDSVVRPVIFLAYAGSMRWRTKAGDELSASLGEPLTKDLVGQAWRTALDPQGQWVPSVLAAADQRLTEVRRSMPDAGGLVIAGDQQYARSYAGVIKQLTGTSPTLVLSDEKGSSDRIAEFAASDSRWMVAVRMVSEGVDVPRLAVGVYATPTATPLYFAQAVGRFVRARRRGETASIFLPSVPVLLGHANEMELQRDHVLDRRAKADDDAFAPEDALLAAAERQQDAPGEQEQFAFEALESAASFDRVLYDGGEFGGEAGEEAHAEQDFLGLPGLLEPHQVTALLKRRQAERSSRRARGVAAPEPAAVEPAEPVEPAESQITTRAALAALRKELNGLVGAWHHRTGQPHGVIHAELRRTCGGPPSAQATAADLQDRIAAIRRWATSRG